jgi:predicted RND superfamily exporter protein
MQAFTGATLVIALMLTLLWHSPRATALVLAPIALAGLLLAAVSVLADMPLNFANVLVLPLLLGIGVDSGIHMVHRYRSGEREDLLSTSTPRAVWWSALTTVASFGSLAFSSHRGMASLGQLLTLGVLLTVAANLLVLPALLALQGRPTGRLPGAND